MCLAKLTEIIGVQTLQQDEEYLLVSAVQLLLLSFFTSLPNSPFYLSPLVTSPLGYLSLLQIVPPFSLNWSFTFQLDTLHLRSQIVPAGGDRSILFIHLFCKQALEMLIHPVCVSHSRPSSRFLLLHLKDSAHPVLCNFTCSTNMAC